MNHAITLLYRIFGSIEVLLRFRLRVEDQSKAYDDDEIVSWVLFFHLKISKSFRSRQCIPWKRWTAYEHKVALFLRSLLEMNLSLARSLSFDTHSLNLCIIYSSNIHFNDPILALVPYMLCRFPSFLLFHISLHIVLHTV